MENAPRLDVILPTVARAEKAKEDDNFFYRPRVSNSGSCPRALTYAMRGYEPKPHTGRMAMLFHDGNVHEDVTIDWLEKTDFSVTEGQMGLNIGLVAGAPKGAWYCKDCEKDIPLGMLHGHIDGLILSEDTSVLFEHKGLGQWGYENLDKEAPIGYIGQCCCYLSGLSNAGIDMQGAILLIKNKNTSEYRQINIEYDKSDDSAIVYNTWNNTTTIHYDVVSGVINLHAIVEEYRNKSDEEFPERPYASDDWHCRFCRFSSYCWDNFSDEVGNYSKNESIPESDDLYNMVTSLTELNLRKTETANLARDLRSKILANLASKEIRSGTCGDIRFSLSSYNKKSLDQSLIPEEYVAKATKFVPIQTLRMKKEPS